MSRQRIGELLLGRGLISQAQLDQGLDAQRRTQRRLGVTLVELNFLSEEQLASALADVLRLARVDLTQVSVDWSAVHLLKPQFCEAKGLFPFGIESVGGRKQLVVAMSDPSDVQATEEIEFTTGLKVQTRVASLSGVRAAILRYYHRVKAPDPIPRTTPVHTQKPEAVRSKPAAAPAPPLPAASPPEAANPPKPASLDDNLDFLFGNERSSGDSAQRLDTLVRLLIRKGLLSEAEWLEALRERGPSGRGSR